MPTDLILTPSNFSKSEFALLTVLECRGVMCMCCGLCVWVLKDTYYLSISQVTKSEMASEICWSSSLIAPKDSVCNLLLCCLGKKLSKRNNVCAQQGPQLVLPLIGINFTSCYVVVVKTCWNLPCRLVALQGSGKAFVAVEIRAVKIETAAQTDTLDSFGDGQTHLQLHSLWAGEQVQEAQACLCCVCEELFPPPFFWNLQERFIFFIRYKGDSNQV